MRKIVILVGANAPNVMNVDPSLFVIKCYRVDTSVCGALLVLILGL
jgi:hypothetical protein